MSHAARSFAPAASRAASSIGGSTGSVAGNPAASNASLRFGLTAVTLPQSTSPVRVWISGRNFAQPH